MFRAWLIYDKIGAERNADYIACHKRAGAAYSIIFTLKVAEDMTQSWEDAYLSEKPDFAIVRTIQPALSKHLEQLGIPVFNNARVSRICNDKGKTLAYVAAHSDVPVVPTKAFANHELSRELLSGYKDSVIKSVDGHGGKQVFLTTDPYEQICEGIGTSDFVIQPFIHGPGQDVRVYVIGREIVGAVKRTSPNGFRANYSLGGSVELYELSEEEREMVKKICRIFSFGLVGIDFLIGAEQEFILNEIEDVVGSRMLYQCDPQVKLLERYLSYIVEKMLQYP